jgi:hypothetical protein
MDVKYMVLVIDMKGKDMVLHDMVEKDTVVIEMKVNVFV